MPLSENVSVVWVPREVVRLDHHVGALAHGVDQRASSAAFLIQAPSFWVYMAKCRAADLDAGVGVRLEVVADDQHRNLVASPFRPAASK